MQKIICFDNGGETYDRFTILDMETGEMIGASLNPFHPQGFGQYCGNPAHSYFSTTVGAGWIGDLQRRDPNHYRRIIKRKTAELVKEAGESWGQLVDFKTLPDEVKQFAKQSFEPVTA